MTERRKPGRPRVGCTEAPVKILRGWITAGKRSATVPEFIEAIMLQVPCSRRTAYRLLHRACDEGKVRLPGF